MKMPLEGCRVIDTTIWFQSIAPMILGDMGAEVIKVEDRIRGDPARGLVSLTSAQTGVTDRNIFFEHCNRNKKSITLDLTKQKGKEILYKLIEKSDIFVQNFRKGIAQQLGLDYATLSHYNPRLIYTTSSGWGPKGPDKDRPSFDLTALARSGIMTIPGEPGMPPMDIQIGIADQMGALMTTNAVLTALYVREKSGIGQEIEASLLGSMVYLLSTLIDFKLQIGVEFAKRNRAKTGNPLFNHYRCKDDKWIVLGLAQPDKYWPNLCHVLGLEHLEKDPRFENIEVRAKNTAEMTSILDKLFATKTRQEWLDILGKGRNLIYEPVNTITDVVNDPQVWANDYIIEFEHPSCGKIPMVGFPMHFSHNSVGVRLPAPEFGQHSEDILHNLLGYSWDDITIFKNEEVI